MWLNCDLNFKMERYWIIWGILNVVTCILIEGGRGRFQHMQEEKNEKFRADRDLMIDSLKIRMIQRQVKES